MSTLRTSLQVPGSRPFLHVPSISLFPPTGTLSYSTGAGADSAIFSVIGFQCITINLNFAGGGTSTLLMKFFDFDGATRLQGLATVTLLAAGTADGDNFIVTGQVVLTAGGGFVLSRQWAPFLALTAIASAGTKTMTATVIGTNP